MRLMFVGDLSMGEHFFSFGHGPRSMVEKGENPLNFCAPLFQEADLVIGNLEGPISDENYDQDDPLKRVFRGAENTAVMLNTAGISVVSVANNHSMQHGISCFEKSVNILEGKGILVIGKSRQQEPWKIKIVDGRRVGFIAASAIDDAFYELNSYRLFEIEEIIHDIELLRNLCDVLIVSVHWGLENEVNENDLMKSDAEKMLAAGADIIAGHHSHIFSPIQVKGGRLVAFGLGDFIFDLPWSKQLTRSAILDVMVDSDSSVVSLSCWPIRISIRGVPKPLLPEVVVLEKGSKIKDIGFDLYGYKNIDRFLSFRKFVYFLIMLPFGATKTKLVFLKWKIYQKLEQLKSVVVRNGSNL